MATFKAQIAGLTGISSGTTPTDAELTEFLKDGVNDVTRRCIQAKPGEATKFTRRSAEQTSQGFDSGGAQILSVIRESGTDNDWRNCRQVSTGLQGRVVDTESLHFASKFNPAYIIEDDGIINVYPAPGSNPDAYKVFYVNASPIDGDGNALTYADSTLGSFPNDKVYLVAIYAAIKTLEAKMAEFAIDEEDTELVQAITSNLTSLKQQYEGAFASMAPPQPQQAAGGRR